MNTFVAGGCSLITKYIIPVALIMSIGSVCEAAPGDYIITQITNDDIDHGYPELNENGEMVWSAWVSVGQDINAEIFYWDGTSLNQITTVATFDRTPSINNAGNITWERQVPAFGDTEIMQAGAFPAQITNNNYDDIHADINDSGHIIWLGYDGTNYSINLWDGTTITQLSSLASQYSWPRMNASGQAAWYYDDGTDYEIVFWNGSSAIQLTNNTGYDYKPDISDSGHVVWYGYDGTDYEIFLWDGMSTTQITHNTYIDESPRVNNNGKITWKGGSGTEAEIYFWDGTSIIQLTNNDTYDLYPQINNNDLIVWDSYDDTDFDYEILLWDGTSTTQITDNAVHDRTADINDNGLIAFIKEEFSDREIFLATPDTTLVTEPLIAHYPFNGDANDISGNTLHGTILGGAGFTTDATGDPDGAIALDGVDDYVQLPYEWAFDLEAFTLAATIQVPDYANENWLIAKGFDYGNYTLRIYDSTHNFFPGYAAYNHDIPSGTNYGMLASYSPVPLNQYFNLAVTMSVTGDLKTYFNGFPMYNASSVPAPALNNNQVTIGAGGFSAISEFFKGDIDEFRIYNVALSNTEIRDLHDTPPVADAGSDQTVTAGDVVTLNGGASYDPDGHTPLAYAWSMMSVPIGSSATLSDPAAIGPSFTADLPGSYIIQLVVSDNLGLAGIADTVTITANHPPVTITGLWPATATVGENVSVFIFGSNFTTDNTTDVYFNGVQQLFVAPVSDEMLIVRLSPVTADLFGPVTVTTPTDSVTSTIEFGAPQISLSITGIWPSTAPIGVSSSVFIFGSEFTIDGSTEVYFNGVRQFLVAPVSEEMLIVRVLGDASLTGPVQIVTPAGSVTSTDTLTFIP